MSDFYFIQHHFQASGANPKECNENRFDKCIETVCIENWEIDPDTLNCKKKVGKKTVLFVTNISIMKVFQCFGIDGTISSGAIGKVPLIYIILMF